MCTAVDRLLSTVDILVLFKALYTPHNEIQALVGSFVVCIDMMRCMPVTILIGQLQDKLLCGF